MKELFLLLALTFTPSAEYYSDADYKALWAKVDAALEEGRPQTAVTYLTQLEALTQKKGDILEQYRVVSKKYECLAKYNWKEANKYYPTYRDLEQKLTGNLDFYIEKYAEHPRAGWLVHRKILQLKGDEDRKEAPAGERYRQIRRMCTLAADAYPADKELFEELIRQMDSKSLSMSCKKFFLYPGDTQEYEFYTRNVSESEFLVYRLSERYQMSSETALGAVSGYGKLVSKQKMSSYKGDYNVGEKSKVEFCFAEPGIYLVGNCAGDACCSELIYVSRVAMSARNVNGKNEIYLADARSGKPFDAATVYAYSDEFTGAEDAPFTSRNIFSQKAYKLDGFTPLTQQLFPKKGYSADIFAEVDNDRWAPAVNVSSEAEVRRVRSSEQVHYIYTDRKLYRPGDTVRFKLIALTTNYESGKVLSGKKINVSLYAPTASKAAAQQTLTTNSMGSAAGAFILPSGEKNGTWRISTDHGGASIDVETYKDPKFRIDFEQLKDIYGFDEQIVQRGRVKGFAGEGIADARVEYTVTTYNYYGGGRTKVAEGTTRSDASGWFDVPFTDTDPRDPRQPSVGYEIEAKAVAPSGETCEGDNYIMVAKEVLDINVSFDNEYRMDTVLLVNKTKATMLTLTARNRDGAEQHPEGWWRLTTQGRTSREGEFVFGEPIKLDAKGLPSGEYILEYGAKTPRGEQTGHETVAFFSPDDRSCPTKRQIFFYPVEDKDAIDFMIGSSEDIYVELEVFSESKVVYRKPLHLSGSAQHIKLDYKKGYADKVTVSVYGIKDMEPVQQRHSFGRTVASNNFDIKVSALRDKTTPNTTETFTVEAPASEMLISIYDITTDRYRRNNFYFSPIHPKYSPVPNIWSNLGGHYYPRDFRYRALGGEVMLAKSAAVAEAPVMMADMAVTQESAVMNDAIAVDDEVSADYGAALPSPDEIDVREDFTQTLAFIPQLQIPSSGRSEVSFTTRDGLSTFRILMLAHTKDLRSGVAERSIIVSKPVKIESNVPLFAVEGDRMLIKATVTNTGAEAINGRASLVATDEATGDKVYLGAKDISLSLDPDAAKTVSWEVEIPDDVRTMGVTVSIAAGGVTDAEKRKVDILPASRYITEAESFVVGSGVTRESALRSLKARFNYPGATYRYEEYSTKDALLDVLKKPRMPKGDNMIEWLDVLYVNQMRGCLLGADSIDVALSRRAASKLSSLQKSDGGYGWFPCNQSSDLLTLMFLDKTYYMREVGKLPLGTDINKQIGKALGYVDKRIEEITSRKNWNWRELTYFFAARMQHPGYDMSVPAQKAMKEYIKRCKKDWQDIPVVEKAKLCTVLEGTGELRQMFTVMKSLRDYAVRNDNVGCYFPNAAMPYRGMLHTELYAHAQLVTVFAEMDQMDIARGIMRWLLLQKHNQQWNSNMASADAIFVLIKYRAPELKFGAVYYTYYAPMLKVGESANQMSVKRSWYKDGKKLRDGQSLYVGDKIEVRYDIDNTENRSFVVMEASRPACFYPVDERSWGSQWFYCERLADRTKYYFQTLAEEDTHLSETFYVTQEGTFNSGLVEIQSLYAPEYRGHTGAFTVETESF